MGWRGVARGGGGAQAGWGVVPTELAWSDALQQPQTDYLWSVGQTPFGPLAKGNTLSFAERDAAAQAAVLMTLNATARACVAAPPG